MVRNTIGPISIFISPTKVVPMGSIAIPASGQAAPTTTPSTMATRTEKNSCRYQRFFSVGGVCACDRSIGDTSDPSSAEQVGVVSATVGDRYHSRPRPVVYLTGRLHLSVGREQGRWMSGS